MKSYLRTMLTFLAVGGVAALATNCQWTNTLGGSWQVAVNWSPNFVPGNSDKAIIAADGTYTVTLTSPTPVAMLDLGGGIGAQTLVVDNGVVLGVTNIGTIFGGGVLIASNCGISGILKIQSGGQLQLLGPATKSFGTLNLNNLGTVFWGGGVIQCGGNPATVIMNSGLWQITGNDLAYNGGSSGGTLPIWYNFGTFRKAAGTGTTSISAVDFVNEPSGTVDVLNGILAFSLATTNPLAGSWISTLPGTMTILGGTWQDAGGVASGTGTNLFNGGVMNLRTNFIPGLKLVNGSINLGGGFQQAGSITNLTLDGSMLNGTNTVSGTLTINGANIPGKLTILPVGQMILTTAATKLFYNANIINQGMVNWMGGDINVGGTPTTVISNSGSWLLQGTNTMYMHNGASGPAPVFINSGILQKVNSATTFNYLEVTLTNLPSGLVESLAGTMEFDYGEASLLGGTFSSTSPANIRINSGIWTDAGGIAIGTGTNQFAGGTLNLRTNTIPGLRLLGGVIYITGTNSFQQAGAITNLTLDGTVLRGTNQVNGGTMIVNAGDVMDRLIIQSAGQLILTGASKNLYNATIINQGTVNWNGGDLNAGGTVISNSGLWQVNGNLNLNLGGGPSTWTNTGTLKKTAGTGFASVTGPSFYNQPGGLVQSDIGTLLITSGTTNNAGTLRLNGGTLGANGTLAFNGGTLDGSGAVAANALTGGTISPGQGGGGLISFQSGLNLGSNAVLTIDGTGIVPGITYDQLNVTGAVALGSSKLKVTSLPAVAVGATFIIITNDGVDAVSGTFSGLPENAVLTVAAQSFRIHYAGGSGNDVTLVRIAGPPVLLGASGLTNGIWQFTGLGTPSGIYVIQASTNFVTWTNLGFATGDIGGNLTFADTNAFQFRYRFYRTTN